MFYILVSIKQQQF